MLGLLGVLGGSRGSRVAIGLLLEAAQRITTEVQVLGQQSDYTYALVPAGLQHWDSKATQTLLLPHLQVEGATSLYYMRLFKFSGSSLLPLLWRQSSVPINRAYQLTHSHNPSPHYAVALLASALLRSHVACPFTLCTEGTDKQLGFLQQMQNLPLDFFQAFLDLVLVQQTLSSLEDNSKEFSVVVFRLLLLFLLNSSRIIEERSSKLYIFKVVQREL